MKDDHGDKRKGVKSLMKTTKDRWTEYQKQNETRQTLVSLIPHEILTRWDIWDYWVSGPLSLDDAPEISVQLINENGKRIRLSVKLRKCSVVETDDMGNEI